MGSKLFDCPGGQNPEVGEEFDYTTSIVSLLDDSQVDLALYYYPYLGKDADAFTLNPYNKTNFEADSTIFVRNYVCLGDGPSNSDLER